jgi:omega-6 fatty acid desaturase (delta-12 desaturase)
VEARAKVTDSIPDGTWRAIVARYQQPSLPKSLWQLTNSLLPFVTCWALAYRSLATSNLASLGFCLLATGFLVRLYIIQHDCGHRSFFKSARANDALGSCLGIITLLPYFRWRFDHGIHHATSGNLAKRGTGDVDTMTVREFRAAAPYVRLKYRLLRSPFVLFGLGPFLLFVVWQRFTDWTRTRREALSVRATNVAIAVVCGLAGHFLGWGKFLTVQGCITLLGSTVAVWLFYVQHQFEDAYWVTPENWDHADSALAGASWYKLPKVLQWFTGNIGIHHIHHLSPKIPNYELQRCLDENPAFQNAPVITLWGSLRCTSLKIFDENKQKLVTWQDAGLPAFGFDDLFQATGQWLSQRLARSDERAQPPAPRTQAFPSATHREAARASSLVSTNKCSGSLGE